MPIVATFRLPVFEYRSGDINESLAALRFDDSLATILDNRVASGSVGRDLSDVIRRMTSDHQSQSIDIPADRTAYSIELDDSAIAGRNDEQRARALRYYGKAQADGSVDRLAATVTVDYGTSGGLHLGSVSFDVVCLVNQQSIGVENTRRSPAKVEYLLINRVAFLAVRQALGATSIKGDDQLTLGAIRAVTTKIAGVPTQRQNVDDEFAAWLEQRTGGADAVEVVRVLQTNFASLYDFELTVPDMKPLTVAGVVTILTTDGVPVDSADFLDLEIVAEFEDDGTLQRTFEHRFSAGVEVVRASTKFAMASEPPLYANAIRGLVNVRVKRLGSEVWSNRFAPDDRALAALDIEIPRASRVSLSRPPGDTREPHAKRLRGRVLTLTKDCSVGNTLVLVQARSSAGDKWRVVGAATTDALGNFSMPYPYGDYEEAQALVSIAPKEMADIPCLGADIEAIADDFIFLLIADPDCPGPHDEDCQCGTEKPSRLPDHSDLIGSEVYSQDLGGTCVNLSKPNRTISEFNYQAIVRSSDPDVATFALTRFDTSLEAIDITVAVALASGAKSLVEAVQAVKAMADQIPDTGSVVQEYLKNSAVELAVSVISHANSAATVLQGPGNGLTAATLASALQHLDAITAHLEAYRTRIGGKSYGIGGEEEFLWNSTDQLKELLRLAIDTVGAASRYELVGGSEVLRRQSISLGNPVLWNTTPDSNLALPTRSSLAATFPQAVSVATGHILHYKAEFKSDGYSLGDLLYSLPLAPGQKKEIAVFDSSHTLVGAESQTLAQNERLALGLINERDIADQLGGRLSESLRGSSSANTSGLSFGLGTGGQGSGGGQGAGGSASLVLGVAGGFANANSNASQNGSRDVAQFFGEKLRSSIMQNAEGYRQLNASVVTTVQEGQRYGVTTEVVANHNHCHALTIMYFEVLRHYAIFNELSSVEECVFVPLLLTKFSTENVAQWRDVIAPALLPMPSETYLSPTDSPNAARAHPLLRAFDADQRIKTNYANVDMPAGSYDGERIQFIRGSMRLRVEFPRPRTRFDRIISLPINSTTITSREIDPAATAAAALEFPGKMAKYALKTAATAGLNNLFGERPPDPPGLQYKTVEKELLVREAIFDAFMKMDANFETVPPAQCIRVMNFSPPPKVSIGPFGLLPLVVTAPEDFFADNIDDRAQWQAYATLLGYPDVISFLNAHFRGNLISEWDEIFSRDIAPIAFERILSAVGLEHFSVDFTTEARYHGGDHLLRVNLAGTTSKKRNELPEVLELKVAASSAMTSLSKYVTLQVQEMRITYATSHYNGTLFSGSLGDDLLDGTKLYIPESSEEKRNPRREDRYLAAKLIDHLNGHLEYYNKILWFNLDPDRRYMLLDSFAIQVYDDAGAPIPAPDGTRSLASVVKNELISVAGNSLVMPVAPGYRVSGSFIQPATDDREAAPVTLFDHYKPLTPEQPFRVSVPTKGVFAEAVQGVCNACEKIENDRLQDWNRFPNLDEPTAISPIIAPTPVVTDWRAAFKDFTAPIVNIQSSPGLPAPGDGLQGLAELLGKSGVFKDITGLDANQANVIRTYLSNQENAKAFAEMAKEMAMQQHNTQHSGAITDSLKSAKDSGALSQQDYGKLVKDHLQQQIDGGKPKQQALTAGDSQLASVTADAARSRSPLEATQSFPDGTIATLKQGVSDSADKFDFTVPGAISPLAQPSESTCWAAVVAMMRAWKSGTPEPISVDGEIAKIGAPYTNLLSNKQELVTSHKNALFAKLDIVIDPIGLASASPDQFLQTMRTFGPLWATVDADLTAKTAAHAKLIYGIRGDGTADGTMLRIIDPRAGTRIEQTFRAFSREFEELARSANPVALNGQIARFADRIAGEGGTADTVYDRLTELVRPTSMGLTANAAAKLLPVSPSTDSFRFEHSSTGGWTGRTVVSSEGLESSRLEFPIEHVMSGSTMTMPFRVLDKMSWTNARVSVEGNDFPLPLTRKHLLATDSANGSLHMGPDSSPTFPLEATLQSHLVLLFGYVLDVRTGAVVPLDLASAPFNEFETWLENGGSVQPVSTSKRVILAVYDLCLNAPNDDFAPKLGAPIGPALVARMYPMLSIWCANACDEAAADFAMTRPSSSAMAEDMTPGAAIRGSFYTDTNDHLRTLWDDTAPAARAVLSLAGEVSETAALISLAWKLLPSSRWNSLFAHYRLATDMPVTMVVDRSRPERSNITARQEWNPSVSAYELTPVRKLVGQGTYDNIHLAPEMEYKGTAASMAPVCQHDCVHLHWRWGAPLADRATKGWSGGVPYSKAGAPMIPDNQNLQVSLVATTFTYSPVATGVGAMTWQIFMHHGMGYAAKLTVVGQMLPLIDKVSDQDASLPSWNQVYYHNRFWETGATRAEDKPRLDEGQNQSNFQELEVM
jgi:hypothetical protein